MSHRTDTDLKDIIDIIFKKYDKDQSGALDRK